MNSSKHLVPVARVMTVATVLLATSRLEAGSDQAQAASPCEMIPGVIFVDAAATGAATGECWPHAFTDLQDALAIAAPGDEIWVAAGTYTPAGPGGDRTASFDLVDDVRLLGGFAGVERDADHRNPVANLTILSGDLDDDDGPGFSNTAENSYHVVQSVGTQHGRVLDGFVICAGNADGPAPDNVGGGMLVNRHGDPRVSRCVFVGNRALVHGGALSNNSGGRPLLIDCLLVANRGLNGGAIWNSASAAPALVNCAIIGNSSAANGSIASIWGTRPMLMNCLLSGNEARVGGGAVWAFNGSETFLFNCTITRNRASSGGGVAARDGTWAATLVLGNSVLWSNGDDGGSDESAQIERASIDPVVDYCDVQGLTGMLGGLGNIGEDPRFEGGADGTWTARALYDARTRQTTFMDAEAAWDDDELVGKLLNPAGDQVLHGVIVGNTRTTVTVWGDFEALGLNGVAYQLHDDRVAPGSPVIDRANNWLVLSDGFDIDRDGDAEELTPTDLAGNPRFADAEADPEGGCGAPVVVDMGAHEHAGVVADPVLRGDVDGDGTVGFDDLVAVMSDWGPCEASCCLSDVVVDGAIDREDLLAVVTNWR